MPVFPKASRFSSWLLKRCLGPASFRRRSARFFRGKFLRFWNAPFQAQYFGENLLFPGQHDLPILTNDLPLFNTPLRRLAQSVRASEGALRLLDIGANIGDGLALVEPRTIDQFWLIEGSAEFLPYLRQNSARHGNASVIPSYLGEQYSVSRGAEVVIAGNAHIRAEAEGEIVFETLDRLFPETAAQRPNLLKIDVEGHEARIFAGGVELLRSVQPVVFMEWHPKLLLGDNADVFASLKQLIAAGYNDAVIYDNHGFLLGDLVLGDKPRLEQLARYAQLRDLFYFDLAVFAPKHASLRENFRASEAAFYAARLRDETR